MDISTCLQQRLNYRCMTLSCRHKQSCFSFLCRTCPRARDNKVTITKILEVVFDVRKQNKN